MKHLPRHLAFLLLAFAAMAADGATYKALVVLLRNGRTDVYRLSDLPRLEFTSTGMNVRPSAAAAVINYQREDVSRFYVEDRQTAVESLQGTQLDINQTAPYTYEVRGLADNDAITVSDIAGRAVPDCVVRAAGGRATVSIALQPNGLYIIRLGNSRTLKINKRVR